MANSRKNSKNLLGDVYDILRDRRDFVTPRMFSDRHAGMEIDYDRLEIRIDKTHTLRLVDSAAE